MKKKVFISFDYDNDKELKEGLIGQSKKDDSPFEITDMSIKEAISSDWISYAEKRIKACQVVAVICGYNTNTAVGVSKEIELAQKNGIPYFLLKGRKDGSVKKPKQAKDTDQIYNWSWKNLKLLIDGAR